MCVCGPKTLSGNLFLLWGDFSPPSTKRGGNQVRCPCSCGWRLLLPKLFPSRPPFPDGHHYTVRKSLPFGEESVPGIVLPSPDDDATREAESWPLLLRIAVHEFLFIIPYSFPLCSFRTVLSLFVFHLSPLSLAILFVPLI